jgi:hypothetical protein
MKLLRVLLRSIMAMEASHFVGKLQRLLKD